MSEGAPKEGTPSESWGAKSTDADTDILRSPSISTMADSSCRSTTAASCDNKLEGSFNSQYDIEGGKHVEEARLQHGEALRSDHALARS